MPYRKVGCLEQLWYLLRWKFRRIFRRKKYVYDFHVFTALDDLKEVLRTIGVNGYQLVCITEYREIPMVVFRRPAP